MSGGKGQGVVVRARIEKPLRRKTLLARSCSLRSRAARATATLTEPVPVENSEDCPRGLGA